MSFIFLVSEEQLTEFVENKDYMILLNALKNFKDEEEIVLHVLHCLHSLAIPCKYLMCWISFLYMKNYKLSPFWVHFKNIFCYVETCRWESYLFITLINLYLLMLSGSWLRTWCWETVAENTDMSFAFSEPMVPCQI